MKKQDKLSNLQTIINRKSAQKAHKATASRVEKPLEGLGFKKVILKNALTRIYQLKIVL
jgi:hypothetical protein